MRAGAGIPEGGVTRISRYEPARYLGARVLADRSGIPAPVSQSFPGALAT